MKQRSWMDQRKLQAWVEMLRARGAVADAGRTGVSALPSGMTSGVQGGAHEPSALHRLDGLKPELRASEAVMSRFEPWMSHREKGAIPLAATVCDDFWAGNGPKRQKLYKRHQKSTKGAIWVRGRGMLWGVIGGLALAGCSSSPKALDLSPRRVIRRGEVMAIAEAYSRHRWRAREANVRHGVDGRGIRVDTPDAGFRPADGTRPGWWVPGNWNVGVPYQWGGFETPEEFDVKVKRGLAAGDIYTPVKRAGLDAAVSAEAAGIDCSGLVSRCWRLERSYSTRELPGLCVRLGSYDELQPGDILNTHNAHVLIFAGWANPARTRVSVYEAGCHPTWKVFRRQVRREFLEGKGYEPFRYRGIRE